MKMVQTLLTGMIAGAAFVGASAMTSVVAAELPRTASSSDAEVYIISPQDGDTVTSPFVVRFGLRGMGVTPAGSDLPNTGHHHLLVDVDQLPPANLPVPADEQHIHFGKGQTETTLSLPEGDHSLQLMLADFRHIPHDPAVVSKRIRIHVAPNPTN